MKTIFVLILLIIPITGEPENMVNSIDKKAIETYINELIWQDNYAKTIAFIKQHEGFRAYVYDDNGYNAIGYGQRLLCYDKQIHEPITKQQAEIILIDSFNEHIRTVKYHFPKLIGNRLLSVAHLSYCKGIGFILRNKLVNNNLLDVNKLRKLPHPGNRQFEVDMFYNGALLRQT